MNSIKSSTEKVIRYILPGFVVDIVSFMLWMFVYFLRIPAVLLPNAGNHKLISTAVTLVFLASVSMVAAGALNLKESPKSDVLLYNEAVSGLYYANVRGSDDEYCYVSSGGYEDDEEPYCVRGDEAKAIRARLRENNLKKVEDLSGVLAETDDPIISSRTLFNIGMMLFNDAKNFKDSQSLEDAILAFQASLREDPTYLDSASVGYGVSNRPNLGEEKRIKLEEALRLKNDSENGPQDWGKETSGKVELPLGSGGGNSKDSNWEP